MQKYLTTDTNTVNGCRLEEKKLKITCLLLIITIMFYLLSNSSFANNTNIPDNIVFKSKIRSMEKADVGFVIYPHKFHESLYKCKDCHPVIFKGKIGANDINMQKNIDGKFCGSSECHNSTEAFPLYLCEKCHTEIKKRNALD